MSNTAARAWEIVAGRWSAALAGHGKDVDVADTGDVLGMIAAGTWIANEGAETWVAINLAVTDLAKQARADGVPLSQFVRSVVAYAMVAGALGVELADG